MVTGRDGVQYLAAEDGFLGLDGAVSDPSEAKAVVIPFGLEASVSYGGGTSLGPEAMIAASHEVELYDLWWGREAWQDYGVATRVAVPIPESIPAALEVLDQEVEAVMAAGRFPVVFGGEHAIAPGAIRAAVRRWPDLVLLHFDAHADLRDGYDGEHFSHAAAIRRCLDNPGVTVLSFGIRNVSEGEMVWWEAEGHRRAQLAWAHDKASWDIARLVEPLRGKTVWITFDVDGFDGSLMPSTGTPEPGGITWDDAMAVLAAASKVWGRVVGCDVNELAPVEGFHAPDFVAAKLAYRLMSLALSGPIAPPATRPFR